MKKENIRAIEEIANLLVDQGAKFYFLDERWKKKGDIDICMAKESLGIFDEIMKKSNFIFKGKWPPWYRFYSAFLSGEFIKIHVHIGKYEGLPSGVLEPKRVIGSRGYFLSPEEQIFYFVYRMALGEPLQKYKIYLNKLAREEINEKRLVGLLSRVFKNSTEILEKVQKARFSELNFVFKLSHNLSRIKMYVLNKSAKFIRYIKKLLSPQTRYIAIIGPDGSGKTWVLNAIADKLQKQKISFTRVSGGRFMFQVLPLNWALKKIEEKYSKKKGGVSHHALRYSSSFIQIILPFVYYIEYLLRHLFVINLLRRRNQIVLSERSFIDVIISPNTHTAIAEIFYRALPKPDITIYLHNTANVLARRKPDHPRYDLERQLKAYGSLAAYFTNKVKTSGRKAVDEVFSIISKQTT